MAHFSRHDTRSNADTIPLPMEAKQVDELPEDPCWQFEPKWDGFRCIAHRNRDRVDLIGKSGKLLSRFFPEVVSSLSAATPKRFALDGELAIPRGSSLSFDALQARLHPAASRIARLARETPVILIVFDALADEETPDLWRRPLLERRAALELLMVNLQSPDVLRLSPFTRSRREAARWLARAGRGALDGVIAKRIDEPYRGGERTMLKVKCLKSADCVVAGFRYETDARTVGSLLLGLYNHDGKLDHVGFTSGFSGQDRAQLTKRLEKLRGGPGFTGDAPGGPSRWSGARSSAWEPLKPKLVAEVRYDHVTGKRFRHGTKFLRWRPDKPAEACTIEQLSEEARPSKVVRDVIKPALRQFRA